MFLGHFCLIVFSLLLFSHRPLSFSFAMNNFFLNFSLTLPLTFFLPFLLTFFLLLFLSFYLSFSFFLSFSLFFFFFLSSLCLSFYSLAVIIFIIEVENGDLNWCIDDKFVAFAGPHATRDAAAGGYHTLCPDDYVPYFKRKNVNLVVRLNKKYYDCKKFTNQGIGHIDLYFIDGSNPPDAILSKFLSLCEATR